MVFFRQIRYRNPVFRIHFQQIQNRQKQPLQWFHHNINCVRCIGRPDTSGDGKSISVIKVSYPGMKAESTFLQNLLKCIGNTIYPNNLPFPKSGDCDAQRAETENELAPFLALLLFIISCHRRNVQPGTNICSVLSENCLVSVS